MPALTATYNITTPSSSSSASSQSPSEPSSNNDTKSFTHQLSIPASSDENQSETDRKTAYLAALRVAVKDLQGELNEFLTAKMEEDKAAAAVAAAAVTDGSGANEGRVGRNVAEKEEEEERRIERGDEEGDEEEEEGEGG